MEIPFTASLLFVGNIFFKSFESEVILLLNSLGSGKYSSSVVSIKNSKLFGSKYSDISLTIWSGADAPAVIATSTLSKLILSKSSRVSILCASLPRLLIVVTNAFVLLEVLDPTTNTLSTCSKYLLVLSVC